MSESIPCPACGSPSEPGDGACGVCGMIFEEPARADKCSRCGSPLGEDFAFCQVCGLAVGLRHARPQTQRLKVVTTAVRELRKRGTGEHAAQSGEFPIGQAGGDAAAEGGEGERLGVGAKSGRVSAENVGVQRGADGDAVGGDEARDEGVAEAADGLDGG
ncbi:MAG: zinc ribbon domain-containing protein, partial [Myxococcales bacterium]|nr:zinc ribbon domain-containing protein [Myxococcales bacterium]